jgi:hypothetical protein
MLCNNIGRSAQTQHHRFLGAEIKRPYAMPPSFPCECVWHELCSYAPQIVPKMVQKICVKLTVCNSLGPRKHAMLLVGIETAFEELKAENTIFARIYFAHTPILMIYAARLQRCHRTD